MSPWPKPDKPGPGQESVWDYPRPPKLESLYYLPPGAFRAGILREAAGSSFCEWKGMASYYDLVTDARVADRAAWAYLQPTHGFEQLTGAIAVMAAQVDRCSVNGAQVEPQPGGFYGGWITSWVTGPFKGIPGSMGW